MYLLFGLPIDYDVSDENILVNLRQYNNAVEILSIPPFSVCDLDTLFHVSNTIANVEVAVNALFKNFITTMRKKGMSLEIDSKSYDFAVKSFKWQKMRFSNKSVSKICDSLKHTIESFSAAYNGRKNEYEKTKKYGIEKIKDMDILAEDYDFIAEHYILVVNSRENDFIELMKIQYGEEQIYELVLKDDENCLFKLFGVKSDTEEIKKMVSKNGFSYREPIPRAQFQKKKEEREENKKSAIFAVNNLELYLVANIDEIFTLFMHVKALRVFVESVLLYGMGKYVFFLSPSQGASRFLKKVVNGWKFSKRINREDMDDENYASVFIEDVMLCELE